MLRKTFSFALLALCAACDLAARWSEARAEVPPVVLFVEQPRPEVGVATLGPQLLTPPPATSDGSEARPFSSLRTALRLAPAGALLRVGEGVWSEQLQIARPIVLLGRGAGRTRIVPPPGTAVAVEVRADHVQLYGLAIEGAKVGIEFTGGAGHRLENVALRHLGEAGLIGRGASIAFVSGEVVDVNAGKTGTGIDLIGGSLDARRVTFYGAGRRAMVLKKARGVLEDLDVRGSSLAALQAIDGTEARVLRGEYDGQGGAALYAGAARLTVDGAHVRHDEFAVIGSRGSELTVLGGELTDYRIAGVAMVKSHGTIQRVLIARGGQDGAIAITRADGATPVLLLDNRIQDPGTLGVHITDSSVTARGNSITGARPDRQTDMGDAFLAIDSELVVEQNVLRGNAGSGVSAVRTRLRVDRNGFIENGRAGVLMLDRSQGTATGNLFERNAVAGVEVGERSRAKLARNRFAGNTLLDIETGCGKGLAGVAELEAGNTSAAPLRQRSCVE
ncbi:MAG: right-handed parallel beta-helix repeat-containing protein [Myxococcales bacterium]